jgi:hypothetical protein
VDFKTTAIADDEWANDIHRRFSHIHVQGLRGLHKVVSDLSAPIPVNRLDKECDTCTLAKQLWVINHQPLEKATKPLRRVFRDY